mmetsp:Transcript_25157/g.29636  ORF Transcript_25157/g.29636 Transcript_25157/m.29636 type:complete len:166 (-) Transcript_25157:280-777(-)|eukprot:CAMPEP_0198256530 /NCGR_PEP_ID=MMETSP1447-20131203/6442_1 /TAXON_ID=420782 /ORGANISM="Chaetoceros dichaeta, Strain CCMP1751" /LENGTH=165 /DNA_ID=CAMNT_0043943213 /DNA_START=29 /DNA_END=526 /DNA_ORIENTATION=-
MKNEMFFTILVIIVIITDHRSSAFSTLPSLQIERKIPTSRFRNHTSRRSQYPSSRNDNDGNADINDAAYLEALQQAAKDPKSFEDFVASRQEQTTATKSNGDTAEADGVNGEKKKSGYVPIEQWDRERSDAEADMSWEEKVRLDGQRFGDKFGQNEILRKNLKSW